MLTACSVWFVNKYFGVEAHGITSRLWPPLSVEKVETRKLRNLAGLFSLDCGHVRHRDRADSAIACAEEAIRTGRAFYVSFDYVGLDSHGTTGLAASSKHELYEVDTNQLGNGFGGYVGTSGIVRTVNVSRCEKAPVEETSVPANRYLTCHSVALLPD